MRPAPAAPALLYCLTMSDDRILVLGATGSTGRRVARRLRDSGVGVKAASRTGPVGFDWTRPDTWPGALDGVHAVYLMAPHELPVDPGFVALAVERGVERVVLLSSRGVREMDDRRLLAAEQLVRGCGVPRWTILRADWFNQNFDEGVFRDAVLAGSLTLPLGELRQGFVDAEDIAAVAVAALTGDGHHEQVYELTGPQALSFPEALEIIGRVTGHTVRYLGDPDDYRAADPSRDVEQEIAAWQAWGATTLTDTVERVTGHKPRMFADYVFEAHERGAWTV